jgi:hypothetical protein
MLSKQALAARYWATPSGVAGTEYPAFSNSRRSLRYARRLFSAILFSMKKSGP